MNVNRYRVSIRQCLAGLGIHALEKPVAGFCARAMSETDHRVKAGSHTWVWASMVFTPLGVGIRITTVGFHPSELAHDGAIWPLKHGRVFSGGFHYRGVTSRRSVGIIRFVGCARVLVIRNTGGMKAVRGRVGWC